MTKMDFHPPCEPACIPPGAGVRARGEQGSLGTLGSSLSPNPKQSVPWQGSILLLL